MDCYDIKEYPTDMQYYEDENNETTNNGWTNIISTGYSNLLHLLIFERPIAYTMTHYDGGDRLGDIYNFGNTAIVNGFAPFESIEVSPDICEKYNDEAREIKFNHSLSREEQRDKINELIKKFIGEVVK